MAFDYWQEAVECALDEAGVKVTPEQLAQVVDGIKGSRENEHMAYAPVENPYPREIQRLEKELKRERGKVICRECNGHGRITIQGPYHSSNSQCSKCRGDGRHK